MESAGIGGGAGNGGTIIINGGSIQAIGGTIDENQSNSGGGAGIGGGFVCLSTNALDITINGGTISATGTDGGAGIGSGRTGYSGATITINGGKVTANADTEGAAGIGRGKIVLPENNPCSITLNWIDAANDTIESSSYAGNVSLTKVFKTNDVPPVYLYGEINNLATIDGKVLTPYVVDKIFVTEGNWNVANNWSPAGVPETTDDVVISAAATITESAQVNTVTIGNGGSLIIAEGGQFACNNSVNVKVQKDIHKATDWGSGEYTPDNWYFIASPVIVDNPDFSVAGLITEGSGEDYDLYRLDNTLWENYKADDEHDHYQFDLENGRGYLYASKLGTTIEFNGNTKPYDATYEVPIAEGWNLIGNPYTFDVYYNGSYYMMNEGQTGLNTTTASTNTPIEPCTGIIVNAAETGSVIFGNTAPEGQSNNGNLNIALTQQVVTRGTATTTKLDNAIVSFNEGDQLSKFYFGDNAKLYIPQNGKDYAIAFSEGQGEMPLNFKAKENGQYTISVNPEGVNLAYLHLIDNMTGNDVDLLALRQAQGPATYTFTAKTTDYESRFRLVFSTVCGDAAGDNETFAFMSNGHWIIANEGEATLQVIDLNGRILSNETVKGSVSKAFNTSAGVYVLRLINGDNVKTQKIVVR